MAWKCHVPKRASSIIWKSPSIRARGTVSVRDAYLSYEFGHCRLHALPIFLRFSDSGVLLMLAFPSAPSFEERGSRDWRSGCLAAVPAAQAADTFDAQIPFSFSSLTLVSSNWCRGCCQWHGLHRGRPGLGRRGTDCAHDRDGHRNGGGSSVARCDGHEAHDRVDGSRRGRSGFDWGLYMPPMPRTTKSLMAARWASSTPVTITYPGTENSYRTGRRFLQQPVYCR